VHLWSPHRALPQAADYITAVTLPVDGGFRLVFIHDHEATPLTDSPTHPLTHSDRFRECAPTGGNIQAKATNPPPAAPEPQ